MPYISDADRVRARWMTLADAIARVAKHDGCDRHSALKELRDALGDRKLHIKWEDQKPIHSEPGIVLANWPPEDASFWQQARISAGGQVFDPRARRSRMLLILEFSILQLWPEPLELASAATAASESGEGRNLPDTTLGLAPPVSPCQVAPVASLPSPSRQVGENDSGGAITETKGGGRPSARDKIHQALDRLSQRGIRVKDTPRKKLAALVEEECGKSRGSSLRTLQKHLPSWLEKH